MIKKIVLRMKLKKALREIYCIDPSKHTNNYESGNARQQAYNRRHILVSQAVLYATELGMEAGYSIHEPITDLLPYRDEEGTVHEAQGDTRWGVVAYIGLPQGQISWHMDSKGLAYDGHTDTEKWISVGRFIGSM